MASLSLSDVQQLLDCILDGRNSCTDVGAPESYDEESRNLLVTLDRLRTERAELTTATTDRARLIIDSTPIAICITDEKGYYQYANPRYRELTQYAPEELIGNHFSMMVPPETKGELAYLHDEFMGQRYELEGQWEIINRRGERIPILANAAYIIDVDGRPKKVTFVTDVRDMVQTRRALEAEVEQRRLQEQIRDQVEHVLRHDLRNPIDGIRTAAEFLLNEPAEESQKEFLRLIREAADRAGRRIDASLAYARMQRGAYELRRARVNAAAIVRRAIVAMQDSIRAHDVHVVATVDGKPLGGQWDVELWGEDEYLEDAIANLVRNAVEAEPAGATVEVAVADRKGDRNRVTICISNATPVPEQIRDAFFEPYVTFGKTHGTGLGTYTARLVARTHGGDAYMTTGERGTEVCLDLPRGLMEET